MKARRKQQHQLARTRVIAALVSLVILSAVSLAWRFHERQPRVWSAEEVPVVFWSWRNETPAQVDIERAVREARAQAIFLRAGQIDNEGGILRRVRGVEGKFPQLVEVHFAYNATRELLSEFERVDVSRLAVVMSDTYSRDVARAVVDGAHVAGIQLDFDIPTRLLERYEQLLKELRAHLPQDTKLSITGLPTWMDSAYLATMLKAVDFWIPQCYGGVIPEKSNLLVPISSVQSVTETIARVRKLDHPFYAGLPAYGYAILYSSRGSLIEVRGDLDPSHIANNPNFELVERRPFHRTSKGKSETDSEWRYVYRVLSDGTTDGLVVHEGDSLMLDVPTAGALRAYARVVREQAGDNLLGLCIFRLPAADDATALTIEQISAALTDTPALIQTEIQLRSVRPIQSDTAPIVTGLRIRAMNNGTASGQFGDDAMTVSVRVPTGSVRGVAEMEGFYSLETLCEAQGSIGTINPNATRPCSLRRANLLRLRARTWRPGASAVANMSFDGIPPQAVHALVNVVADDGRSWQQEQSLLIRQEDDR